jgi:hypothetical protein
MIFQDVTVEKYAQEWRLPLKVIFGLQFVSLLIGYKNYSVRFEVQMAV